ncbi:MAG: RluA family pseudouridine synthase [Oscillospiraceae bacterium]|nr:RluA family pseudouridine synthase [Oscillospiraceae bacterium]
MLWTQTVPPERDGSRADVVLGALGPLSRSAAQRLIAENRVRLNGETARKNTRVKAGDRLEADIPEPEPAEARPEAIPLDILYEDADLLVVNKPRGLVVHPAPGHPGGTLVNALLHHCGDSLSGIGGVRRPGIVHRIDKDTGGLLVAAKTDFAHAALSAALKAHEIERVYTCLARGCPKADTFTVDAPLGRHPVRRKEQAVLRDGRRAVTHVEVLARYAGKTGSGRYSRLLCRLETGRTHQIRVHLAHIGHPIAGDPLYGADKSAPLTGGQLLHAGRLSFTHPRTGGDMRFTVPEPAAFQEFLYRKGLEVCAI